MVELSRLQHAICEVLHEEGKPLTRLEIIKRIANKDTLATQPVISNHVLEELISAKIIKLYTDDAADKESTAQVRYILADEVDA